MTETMAPLFEMDHFGEVAHYPREPRARMSPSAVRVAVRHVGSDCLADPAALVRRPVAGPDVVLCECLSVGWLA